MRKWAIWKHGEWSIKTVQGWMASLPELTALLASGVWPGLWLLTQQAGQTNRKIRPATSKPCLNRPNPTLQPCYPLTPHPRLLSSPGSLQSVLPPPGILWPTPDLLPQADSTPPTRRGWNASSLRGLCGPPTPSPVERKSPYYYLPAVCTCLSQPHHSPHWDLCHVFSACPPLTADSKPRGGAWPQEQLDGSTHSPLSPTRMPPCAAQVARLKITFLKPPFWWPSGYKITTPPCHSTTAFLSGHKDSLSCY